MREFKCKCDGKIKEDICIFEGFNVKCLKCDNCGDITFSSEQARDLIKLREANNKIQAKRKIIKVGSSIAALLPKKVEDYGINEGIVDNVKVLSHNSLEIKFDKDII